MYKNSYFRRRFAEGDDPPLSNQTNSLMDIFLQVLTLLGALAMFLYGMTMMSEGLQKAAGEKLRGLLASMTSNPFNQILTGLIVTGIIQSSCATTVMVVSFVNAGLLTLTSAIGVIMGANIGTTVTAWIITFLGFSFDISSLSIPLILVGFVLTMYKKTQYKNIGQLIIGFALLFLGLSFLKDCMQEISQNPALLAFLQSWTGHGFWTIILFLVLGLVLTIIMQSSSVTMTLTLVMVNYGWIPFDAAAAMVVGENIGTTITANLAASVGNASSKRTALAHTLFNVFGAVWVLIFFRPFLKLIGIIVSALGVTDPTTINLAAGCDDPEQLALMQRGSLYGISMLQTLFNAITTLLLIGFTKQIEKLLVYFIKSKQDEEVYRLKFISAGPLRTAELSLDEATHEIVNYGEICYRDFGYIRAAINETDDEKFAEYYQKLVHYEEITDNIEAEIAAYLTEVSSGELSEMSSLRIKAMYRIISEMESLGDSGEAIGRIIQRKNAHGKEFTEDLLDSLNLMLDTVDKAFLAMLNNLRVPHGQKLNIENAKHAEDAINMCRNMLREEHIEHLDEEGYNYQLGAFYMDIIAELENMGDIIINISQAIER